MGCHLNDKLVRLGPFAFLTLNCSEEVLLDVFVKEHILLFMLHVVLSVHEVIQVGLSRAIKSVICSVNILEGLKQWVSVFFFLPIGINRCVSRCCFRSYNILFPIEVNKTCGLFYAFLII